MDQLRFSKPRIEVRWPEEPATESGHIYPPEEPDRPTEDQLRVALRSFGRMGAARAHLYLGTKVFRAIERLGEGWHWGWLCQQEMRDLPRIAEALDRKLGRWRAAERPLNSRPLQRDPFGGGQYSRNLTQLPPRLEPKHNARAIICSELRGRVAGYDYWVDELTDYGLTSGDWRRIVGHGLKLMDQEKLKYSLQAWLKHVARAEAEGYKRAESRRVEEETHVV